MACGGRSRRGAGVGALPAGARAAVVLRRAGCGGLPVGRGPAPPGGGPCWERWSPVEPDPPRRAAAPRRARWFPVEPDPARRAVGSPGVPRGAAALRGRLSFCAERGAARRAVGTPSSTAPLHRAVGTPPARSFSPRLTSPAERCRSLPQPWLWVPLRALVGLARPRRNPPGAGAPRRAPSLRAERLDRPVSSSRSGNPHPAPSRCTAGSPRRRRASCGARRCACPASSWTTTTWCPRPPASAGRG